MLEALDEFRFLQSQIVQVFDERHQDNFVPMPAFANANRVQTKAASEIPDAALAKPDRKSLEGEIYACADHPEVVLWSIDEIPAEIADPANVRGEANFHATADLPDCPRLGTGLFSANDPVVHDNIRAFAATKDSPGSAKKVRREARAGNRVAQRQCA